MKSATAAPRSMAIASSLDGQCLFITGATGFLGKVLVEKLLWSVPGVSQLILLIRSSQDRDAQQRLQEEILAAPIMARLRARYDEHWPTFAAAKITALAGDLDQDRFGLDPRAYAELCQRVDRVVASAATVTFDERLDRSLAINVRGTSRTLELARAAGDVPLLQVSTCFVSGRREGLIEERAVGAEALDLDSALAALEAACLTLRQRGETADSAWVAAGSEQAKCFAFNDIYTLTKALGERLLVRHQGAVPLAILRPAIVESAAPSRFPAGLKRCGCRIRC